MYKERKSKGFSLAEMLFALTIIGVVASLTIPELIIGVQQEQSKTAWKKNYSVFSQVMTRLADANGGNLKNSLINADIDNFRNTFTPYLNIVKICDNGASDGECWHINDGTYWSYEDETGWVDPSFNYSGVILSDGTLVQLNQTSHTCTAAAGGSLGNTECGRIYVDVNGFKDPNRIGVDIFALHVLANKLVPVGSNDGETTDCGATGTYGWGCSTARILQ